jgi:hypothetical protein
MQDIAAAVATALTLVATLDPGLVEIVLLSLTVSLTAVALASLIGLPLGAAVALFRFPGRPTGRPSSTGSFPPRARGPSPASGSRASGRAAAAAGGQKRTRESS